MKKIMVISVNHDSMHNQNLANDAVSSVAKTLQSVREVWGLITGWLNRTRVRQRLATALTFVWSYVAYKR